MSVRALRIVPSIFDRERITPSACISRSTSAFTVRHDAHRVEAVERAHVVVPAAVDEGPRQAGLHHGTVMIAR